MSLLITASIVLENFNIFNFNERSQILAQANTINTDYSFIKSKNTLHLPVKVSKAAVSLNWATITQEKVLNGYSGYMPPDWISLTKNLDENLDENGLKLLSAININYVIIHKDLLDGKGIGQLTKNYGLYKNGAVFEDNNFLIIDSAKFQFNIQKCDFNKDLKFNLQRIIVKGDLYYYTLTLQPQKDCYLSNILQDRYRNLTLEDNGIKRNFHLKLPIVVEPFQKVIVSELTRGLTVD